MGGTGLSRRFEELDWRETPMGAISLRRRLDPALKVDVYEVKLDDEFLMSSLFTVAEIELARLGLAALPQTGVDVVVGGLGLGYTARAVLEDPGVRSLTVVEALGEVIGWHQRDLLPFAGPVTSDPRSRLVHGDFFAMARGDSGFDPQAPGRRFHAVLLDVDHAPDHLLHPSHADFYTADGLRLLGRHLLPGGVFALWSNDPPDEGFGAVLGQVFATWKAHVVTFPNPLQDREASNTVYVATTAP
jgi:spermidine synthase